MNQDKKDIHPYNCSQWVWDGTTLSITRANFPELLKIQGNDSLDIIKFLSHSDGTNSIENIANICSISLEKSLAIYNLLIREAVIFQSSSIWKWFLNISKNPSQFSRDLSEREVQMIMDSPNFSFGPCVEVSQNTKPNSVLAQTLKYRESCRSFDKNYVFSNETLFDILQILSNSENHWTIPSAGGLYSFIPVVIVLRQTETLSPGVYFYNPQSKSLHQSETTNMYHEKIWYERMLESTPYCTDPTLIILLGSNVEKVSKKYSNRALRFCLIEAGHMAQNLMIYAAEKDLGCLEYGGFDDEIASLIIGDHSIIPLTCLIVGKKDVHTTPREESLLSYLKDSDQIRTSVQQKDDNLPGYISPFIKVTSHITGEDNFGFGVGTSFEEAFIKSSVEVIERKVSTDSWFDIEATARELINEVIYPHMIYGYHHSLYTNKRFELANSSTTIKWVKATYYTNQKLVYVPMENVFYGCGEERFGINSSNGVAAHENSEKAFHAAFLELFERDAFIALFHSHRSTGSIPLNLWPQWMINQSLHLQKIGFDTFLIDLTIDGPIVILVCIKSMIHPPYFVSGSAASFDYEIACKKAFQEAEFMLTSWVKEKCPQITEVTSPDDHGALYFNPDNISKIEWIFNQTPVGIPSCLTDWDRLLERFNPCYIDITKHRDSTLPIRVVRVISTKLFPMYFGFGLEPYSHERRSSLPMKWVTEYPAYPHFFN